MNGVNVQDVRSFVLLGHTGSGKTTIVDALLHKLGLNDRLGSVNAGSSMADFTDEEKGRNISIFAKPFCATFKNSGKNLGMVFLDTPGYLDFYGQVVSACRAAETGLIVVDASSGVQVGTRQAWKACDKAGLSKAIVITGLDKDNVSFDATLDSIQTAFGSGCVPVILPTSDCSAVIDVLGGKDIPEDLAAKVEEIKGSKTNGAPTKYNCEAKDENSATICHLVISSESDEKELQAGALYLASQEEDVRSKICNSAWSSMSIFFRLII